MISNPRRVLSGLLLLAAASSPLTAACADKFTGCDTANKVANEVFECDAAAGDPASILDGIKGTFTSSANLCGNAFNLLAGGGKKRVVNPDGTLGTCGKPIAIPGCPEP